MACNWCRNLIFSYQHDAITFNCNVHHQRGRQQTIYSLQWKSQDGQRHYSHRVEIYYQSIYAHSYQLDSAHTDMVLIEDSRRLEQVTSVQLLHSADKATLAYLSRNWPMPFVIWRHTLIEMSPQAYQH